MAIDIQVRVLKGAAVALTAWMGHAASAAAQEGWSFTRFEAAVYDSLIDTDDQAGLPCCAPHVIAIDGHRLLHLSGVLDVPWSDDLKRVSLNAPKMTLTIGESEPLRAVGRFVNYGEFESAASSISVSRPRDWPEQDADFHFDLVFAVPVDATSATLNLGEHASQAVEIPAQVSEPPKAGDAAQVAITGIAIVDKIPTVRLSGGQQVTGRIKSKIEGAKIIAVDFDLTPTGPNMLDYRGQYLFHTTDMQLLGPGGVPLKLLGQVINKTLLNDSTNSIAGNSYLGKPFSYTFYYLGDGRPGTYRLFYSVSEVAEVSLP